MNHGKTHEIECNGCKNRLDAFTHVGENEEKPNDGDISICAYCGMIGKYADGMTKIKELSKEEMEEIKSEDPDSYNYMMKASDTIKSIIKLKAFNH